MSATMHVFPGTSNPALAQGVCKYLGRSPDQMEVTRFADGEMKVVIKENVRDTNCFVVQPTCTPTSDNLMELLITVDALKRKSAGKIIAVMPYFGYARQDRKTEPGAPITAKLVADMLQAAGVDRVVAVDLHSAAIQGFFDIPVDNLYAREVLIESLEGLIEPSEKVVVVSPDAGGVARAREVAKKLGVQLAIIDKRRNSPNESEVLHLIGDVKGHHAIIVDDMIDTAGTLCHAVDALAANGASAVTAVAAHGVLSGPAYERIGKCSALKHVVVTDSIPKRLIDTSITPGMNPNMAEQMMHLRRGLTKVTQVSLATLIGESIRRINNGESISALFT